MADSADAATAPAVRAPRRANVTGYGVVKGVPSGDTLALMGAAPAGTVPPQKEIVLSGIIVPRLGRSKSSKDEAYAWYAKEFLRKKCVGQQVYFSINFSTSDGGREYGDVRLGDEHGEDLASALVAAGLATTKPGPTGKDGKMYPEKEAMMALQETATKAGLGMWRKGVDENDMIRSVNWNPNQAFFNAVKGKAIPAIVDKVLDGSRIMVEIPQKGLKNVMLPLYLAGIQCPRVPPPYDFLLQQWQRNVDNDPNFDKPKPEKEEVAPFAKEAQFFVEARLLSRDVRVVLQGCDKYNNMFGSIEFYRGNISNRLLEEGLAEFVDWSAGLTPNHEAMAKLAVAAKIAKKGLWTNFTGEAKLVEKTSFSGKCVQVLSGDRVVILNEEGKEDQYPLASIRCPREGRRGDAGEPYGFEAKEFLRNRLVGRKVKVINEYKRVQGDNERQFVSVLVNDRNVAEELVLEGYATLINHRTDEPRSTFYAKLMMAENTAAAAQKGVHSKSPKKARRVMDLTVRERRVKNEEGVAAPPSASAAALTSRARQALNTLQGQKTNVVTDYVFGGGKVKCLVPKENLLIAFVLAGIRCPSNRDADEKLQALGAKATAFTRNAILQQNTRVEVETLDRGDNFIGTMYTPNGKNLAVELLKQGLASVYDFSADKSAHRDALYAAEAEAKEAKIGMWDGYVEPVKVKEDEEEDTEKVYSEKDKAVEIKLTEIVDGATFFAHITTDANVAVVEEGMEEFSSNVPEADPAFVPAKGQVYAGNWEGSWARVRCDGVTADGTYRVNFIDYGNHDLLDKADIRPISAELAKVPALARPMCLAGIKAPGSRSDYFSDSAYALQSLTWGKTLSAKIELRSRDGKHHVTLSTKTEASGEEEPEEVDIGEELLRTGWVRVHQRPEFRLKAFAQALMPHQQYAMRGHYNIWEYGDVSDEESDGGRDTGRPGVSRFAKDDDKKSSKSSK